MPFRRSILLVNKRFQLRFVIYVCSWVVSLSFIYPLIVNNLFEYFVRYAALDPHGPPLEGIQKVRLEVVTLLIVFQVIFLGISLVISLFMSHRIAGPLSKLSKVMESVRKGKLHERLVFRTKDHFRDLAESFNLMVDGLRNTVNRNSETISGAISNLEEVKKECTKEQREKIDQALASLREVREKMSQ